MWGFKMPDEKNIGYTGAEHYVKKYSTELDINAEWLRLGAVEKVNSIEELLKQVDFSPQTILEIGAGTGAIIEECMRRGIGRQFFAVDYSSDAIKYLKDRHKEFLTVAVSDITKAIPFEGMDFDLIILSHILEHLEQPDLALKNAINRCRYLIAEVPLEDLPFGRFKSGVR
jgi:ubiquinone/menaquinone biosynthesis C-methylase UbiE